MTQKIITKSQLRKIIQEIIEPKGSSILYSMIESLRV